jgi:hypothetical protein
MINNERQYRVTKAQAQKFEQALTRSWWVTIREQRRKLKLHLKENPSLKPYLAEAVELQEG